MVAAKKKPAAPAEEKPAKKKVFKFPKTMGGCADKVYELRQKRLDAQKIVDAIEEEEKALKEHIINTLPKSESSGVAGKLARVAVVVKDVPQVGDWPAFYKHIKKTGAFELMGRSISKAAVEEVLATGKKIPGIQIFHAVSLSINKV